MNLDDVRLKAQTVAEKIRVSIGKPFRLTVKRDGQPDVAILHQCSASIGAVIFSQNDTSPDDILKWADAAMYQAKKAGRNTVRFHSK